MDMGTFHWILGIEVRCIHEERKLMLSQKAYIESILRQYGFKDLKPVSTPMDPASQLSTIQSPSTTKEYATMKHIPYNEAVGSLMYATLGTRPDICYAVQTVSKFNNKLGLAHWEAIKRIFKYLIGTKNLWLCYGSLTKELHGYVDANRSMNEDHKAISGYAFMVNGGAVSWSVKHQELIFLSTTKSKYIAVTHAAKEALWLHMIISQQYHARTKHIDIWFHFICWVIEDGKLRLIYCPTDEMVADALTKALPSTKVKHFADAFGLVAH